MKYRHKTTAGIYSLLGVAVDKSDDLPQNPRIVVIYCPDGQENTLFVRTQEEFQAKFDPADAEAIAAQAIGMG